MAAIETITVGTEDRLQVVDVTDRVREAVPDDAKGSCTVFVQHATGAIAANESEPRLTDDFEDAYPTSFLERDGPTTGRTTTPTPTSACCSSGRAMPSPCRTAR